MARARTSVTFPTDRPSGSHDANDSEQMDVTFTTSANSSLHYIGTTQSRLQSTLWSWQAAQLTSTPAQTARAWAGAASPYDPTGRRRLRRHFEQTRIMEVHTRPGSRAVCFPAMIFKLMCTMSPAATSPRPLTSFRASRRARSIRCCSA